MAWKQSSRILISIFLKEWIIIPCTFKSYSIETEWKINIMHMIIFFSHTYTFNLIKYKVYWQLINNAISVNAAYRRSKDCTRIQHFYVGLWSDTVRLFFIVRTISHRNEELYDCQWHNSTYELKWSGLLHLNFRY